MTFSAQSLAASLPNRATLLTAAAGQGKTHEVILRVQKLMHRNPFSKIWVLLPTELQIGAFRSRLLAESGGEAHFGVEYFDFYDLYERILEIGGLPQRSIKDTARYRILRHILDEQHEDLRYFHRIASTPGFVALVADFIQELKQARITPEEFTTAAVSAKDRDLSLIYQAYQTFLRERSLVDGEGEGWLALAKLEASLDLVFDVDMLIVDGYDQFNPVQAALLFQMSNRVRDMLLTLTYQADRADSAHRRFSQTRDTLVGYGVFTEQALPAPQDIGQPVLHYLGEQIFSLAGAESPAPLASDGALALVEAPDRRREVQAVLRRIKRLLQNGTAPEQIVILARNLEPYTPYILEGAPVFGVPVMMRGGAPLAENPAVASLLALLDLPTVDYPRRATIDALRSPYLRCRDLLPEQIDALDRISRARIVVRGQDNWLTAIRQAGMVRADEDGELPPDALSVEAAEALQTSFATFCTRITPPKQATARQFVAWLEGLIGPDRGALAEYNEDDELEDTPASFEVVQCIREAGMDRTDQTNQALIARDLLALTALKGVLRDVLAAYELVNAYQAIPWETFRLDLRIAIDNATVSTGTARGGNRLGQVLVATVFEARGLPHQHIFVLGLSEGEFPARAPEDNLYTDDERRQMQTRRIALRTRAEALDESSLFYEIVTLGRKSLTLLRPYVDDKGNDWPASPFWRAVRAVIDIDDSTVDRLPLAGAVPLDQAAHVSELMVALADALNNLSARNHVEHEEPMRAHRWLLSQAQSSNSGASWVNTLRCRHIEHRRLSEAAAHDRYTGRLYDPALLELVRELLGPDYMWSASQFNEYGTCPYRFFARRLLHLQALEEPEEGLNQLQYGQLVHEILEHTYRQIAEEGLTISEANRDSALAILDSKLDALLPGAPHRHGFRASAMWNEDQAVLRRKLRTLVTQDFSLDSPLATVMPGVRQAYRQEVRFGFDDPQQVVIEGGSVPLRVRGAIDRVDVDANGRIVVVDYKTGSTTIPPKEMVEGRNVQMMLYMLAAQQIFPGQPVAGGAFWHISPNELSGTVQADSETMAQVQQARDNLLARIEDGRQGVFINVPSKQGSVGPNASGGSRCSAHCDYGALCRADRTTRRKPLDAEAS